MINPLVMAELEKARAEAARRLEQVLATQRSTPTIGRSQTQLSLQRRARELRDQVDGWTRVIVVARFAELEDNIAARSSEPRQCPTRFQDGEFAGEECAGTAGHAGGCTGNADNILSEQERG